MICQQAGSDDAMTVSVRPGYAHALCWSRYADQRLAIALDDWPGQWSDVFSIDSLGNHLHHIGTQTNEGNIPLTVNIESITALHKMVREQLPMTRATCLLTSDLSSLTGHHQWSYWCGKSALIHRARVQAGDDQRCSKNSPSMTHCSNILQSE